MMTTKTRQIRPHTAAYKSPLLPVMVGLYCRVLRLYIYATAAVLVFPRRFFPASDPASSTLAHWPHSHAFSHSPSRCTLRPLRRSLGPQEDTGPRFIDDGPFDLCHRRVADNHAIGLACSPLLLALCRFGQGIVWALMGRVLFCSRSKRTAQGSGSKYNHSRAPGKMFSAPWCAHRFLLS